MSYMIGISTGFYRIAKVPELLGIASKIAYGSVAGVRFVQIDMESTAEFYEPDLKEQVDRVKNELGMIVGMHGEIGPEIMSVDSALFDIWNRTHDRLCESLQQASKLGFVYVNVHLSARPQVIYEESKYRIQGYFYPVVGYDGRPLHTICDKSKVAKQIAKRQIVKTASRQSAEGEKVLAEIEKKYIKKGEETFKKELEKLRKTPQWKAGTPEQRRGMESALREKISKDIGAEHKKEHDSSETTYQIWKQSKYTKYIADNSEISAYEIMAHYMKETGDPLWTSIGGGIDPEYTTEADSHAKWNAAVAAKYLEGHMTVTWHHANKKFLGGLSIQEFCEKKKIYMLFEVPESGEGMEGLYRFFNPVQAYHLLKKLNSTHIKLCLDFEHMLAQKLNPHVEIPKWPKDMGKWVALLHVGKPVIGTPGTTHAQIPLGSRAQELVYTWSYWLKHKGFKDGWIIYERGGGQTPLEVVQQSVQALRQIMEFLNKDIKPDDLPEEFFGISEQNEAVYKRQLATIKLQGFDPLQGLLMVPEETHTFLGKAALDKGKAEEWKKGTFR